MALASQNIVSYWATQSSLTSLIPANKVYLDIAADGATMPYAIFTMIGGKPKWMTDGSYISPTEFHITVYATSLSSLSSIVDAIYQAFKWKNITANGFGCRFENSISRGERGGAFSAVMIWTLFETLT